MSGARAVLLETARTFDLRGRTSRADYLWFLLAAAGLFAICIALCIKLFPAPATAIYVVTAIFYLPVTAAGVRRLHDVGESGALMLEPLKPVAGFFVILGLLWLWASGTQSGTLLAVFSAMFFGKVIVAILVVSALFVLVATLMFFSNTMGLLLLPSQRGPNTHGPNPHEVVQ